MKVFIESCNSYNQAKLDRVVEKILSQIEFKLPKHPQILLKPNLLMPAKPERAITTHPRVVEAVCRFFKKKYPKAKLMLGDSSGCLGLAGTKKAFRVCGMTSVMKKFNVQAVPFEDEPIVETINSKARVWKRLKLPKVVKEADLIVNLPKLKTHSLTRYTGAVKNIYGCLPGGIKGKGHAAASKPDQFSHLILDVFQSVHPGLTIMDAVVGMEGAGPSNGTPKKAGYLLASTNGIALDAVALKLIGMRESEVFTQVNAKLRGMYPKYKVVGKFSRVKFKHPSNLKMLLIRFFPKPIEDFIAKRAVLGFLKSPEIVYKKCTQCYTCVRICPVKAISIKDKLPVINNSKCIKCLSCAEHCPFNAIRVKQGFFKRAMKTLKGYFK